MVNQKCVCGEGFYELEGSAHCYKCSKKCKSCKGSEDFCTECQSGRNQAPFCECGEGFYENKLT